MSNTRRNKKSAGGRGDHYRVNLSSGYTAIIRKPALQVVNAVRTKAEHEYPYPEPPVEVITTVTGVEHRVPNVNMEKLHRIKGAAADSDKAAAELADLTEEERDLLGQILLIDGKRNEYFLDFIFSERLLIEGYEDDDARQALIAEFADEIDELARWGNLSDELLKMKDEETWQFVLRVFLVADTADYAAIIMAANKAFDVSALNNPEELRSRVALFRG